MLTSLALVGAVHGLHVLLEVGHELLDLFGILASLLFKLLLQVFFHVIVVCLVSVVHFAVLFTPGVVKL